MSIEVRAAEIAARYMATREPVTMRHGSWAEFAGWHDGRYGESSVRRWGSMKGHRREYLAGWLAAMICTEES